MHTYMCDTHTHTHTHTYRTRRKIGKLRSFAKSLSGPFAASLAIRAFAGDSLLIMLPSVAVAFCLSLEERNER